LRKCTRQLVAEGAVSKVLNEHYSVVDFPAGVVFSEGDSVEKSK
jgi:hypothetical protein